LIFRDSPVEHKGRVNNNPIVTPGVVHQIQLLKDDAYSLWRIGSYVDIAAQGTSINENLHSYLSSIKPLKTSKVTIEMLEIMAGVGILNYHKK
jgi:hypothetical protein